MVCIVAFWAESIITKHTHTHARTLTSGHCRGKSLLEGEDVLVVVVMVMLARCRLVTERGYTLPVFMIG